MRPRGPSSPPAAAAGPKPEPGGGDDPAREAYAGRRRVVPGSPRPRPRPARPCRPGAPRPAQASAPRPQRSEPGPGAACSALPQWPGKETGNTRRRRHYSAWPPAPSRRRRSCSGAVAPPGRNGRLRGGAAPARPGVWPPAVPGDRPLKGTGVAARPPRALPRTRASPSVRPARDSRAFLPR